MKFLIIDGSYYNFFRYYAIMQWFGLSHPGEEIGIPVENHEFVEKFRTTFVEKMVEVQKKLSWDKCIKIVAKDCPRKEIWRNQLFETYKEGRDKDEKFMGGPLFKMAYAELFHMAGVNAIVSYPQLEADDCAALTIRRILETVPDAEIVVITSDMDYLQLLGPQVKIMNLKYQYLAESKNATGDPDMDKFCKIVCGDKSDDIPGIFKKCGIKTAIKLYHDREAFNKKLAEEPSASYRYELNQRLVDFDRIPVELVYGFRRDVLRVNE
jgi:5'-3' exonuclease